MTGGIRRGQYGKPRNLSKPRLCLAARIVDAHRPRPRAERIRLSFAREVMI